MRPIGMFEAFIRGLFIRTSWQGSNTRQRGREDCRPSSGWSAPTAAPSPSTDNSKDLTEFNDTILKQVEKLGALKAADPVPLQPELELDCTQLPIDLRLYILGFISRVLAPMSQYDSFVIGRFVDDERRQWYLLHPHELSLVHNELASSVNKKNTKWQIILSQVQSIEIEVRGMELLAALVKMVSPKTAPNLRAIDFSCRSDPNRIFNSPNAKEIFDYKYGHFWHVVRSFDVGNLDFSRFGGLDTILEHMPRLEHLAMYSMGYNPRVEPTIKALNKHQNLRFLEFGWYREDLYEADMSRLLEHLQNEKCTRLRVKPPGPNSIPKVQSLVNNAYIQELEVEMPNYQRHVVDQLFVAPSLRKLTIREMSVQSLEMVTAMPMLTTLSICFSRHTQDLAVTHWESLCAVPCLKHLVLHYFSMRLNWASMFPVFLQLCKNGHLESLEIRSYDGLPPVDDVIRLCKHKLQKLSLTADFYRQLSVKPVQWTSKEVLNILFSTSQSLRSLVLTTRNARASGLGAAVVMQDHVAEALVQHGLYDHIVVQLK